jgi:Snare region anchored in the vesicle membrane C-terminus
MWKKKAAATTRSVTVLEEELDGDAGGSSKNDYQDLGLGAGRPRGYGDDEGLAQMSADQLEALALSSAQTGSEGTARALAMALETREIGVSTAQTMKQQTEQLERLGDEIEVVHAYLDKSDRVITKMSKPKIVRMFQLPKKDGKGLDKMKGSKKDQAERDALKARGLGVIDVDGMSRNPLADGHDDDFAATSVTDPRDELFEVQDVRKNGKRSKSSSTAAKPSHSIQDDYSHYSTGVATAMRKQDQDLDQISGALTDMKTLADGMNAELTYQDKLITEIQDFTDETSRRTKDNTRRVKLIK